MRTYYFRSGYSRNISDVMDEDMGGGKENNPMIVRARFSSFEDLSASIASWERKNHVELYVRPSKRQDGETPKRATLNSFGSVR